MDQALEEDGGCNPSTYVGSSIVLCYGLGHPGGNSGIRLKLIDYFRLAPSIKLKSFTLISQNKAQANYPDAVQRLKRHRSSEVEATSSKLKDTSSQLFKRARDQ